MAEYADREKSYGKTAAGQIAGILEAGIKGAHHLEDIYAQRIEEIMTKPNLDINLLMSMLGIPEGLRYSASLPSILRARLRGLFVTEIELEGHMDVHASTEDDTHSTFKSATDVSGKAGWGPVSVGIKIHAEAGVEQTHKRASDYSAGIKWRILATTEEPPEALMKVVDSMCRFQDTVTDMNAAIAEAEADVLRQKAFDQSQNSDADEGDTDEGIEDSESGDGFSDDSETPDSNGNGNGSDDGFSDDSEELGQTA